MIGYRSKREWVSFLVLLEIILLMIVYCINNNICIVGIYLIDGVFDKMLDLVVIKCD